MVLLVFSLYEFYLPADADNGFFVDALGSSGFIINMPLSRRLLDVSTDLQLTGEASCCCTIASMM